MVGTFRPRIDDLVVFLTLGEKYNKVVDAWSKCSDQVADAMMGEISATRKDDAGAEKALETAIHR